jgi:peptidase YpeB-like protein
MRTLALGLFFLLLGFSGFGACVAQDRPMPQSPGIAPRLPQDPLQALEDKQKRLAEVARISLSEAVRIGEKAIPGRSIEAVLDEDQNHIIYKVTILDANKKLHYVRVDGVTGKVIEGNR